MKPTFHAPFRLPLLSLLLAGHLAACGAEPEPTPLPVELPEPLPFEPAGPDAAPDPGRPGPFPVGVRTLEFRDPARPRADGTPRVLKTEVWYPAVEAARGQPGERYDMRPVLTDAQRALLAEADVVLLETPAVRDAAARTDRGPYPLVVFSHGQGGIRWQSTFYTTLLASHGYVVLSPDHEGGTLYEALRDEMDEISVGVEYRPLDVSLLLTQFKRLKADHPLAGLADSERIGVTGHSFGGLTSLRAAALDKRIKVIVPQTPPSTELSWIGLTPLELDIPVMIQAGRRDRTLPWDEHIEPSWPALKKPRYLFELVNGGHFTFSDLCTFDLATLAKKVGLELGDVLEDGCGPPAPAAGIAHRLINHFAVGMFNAELRKSPGSAALLTREAAEAIAAGEVRYIADP